MAGGPNPTTLGAGRGPGIQRFSLATPQPPRFVVGGLATNSTGTPVAGAVVNVFETATNLFRQQTVTDANGNWSVEANGDARAYFANVYLPGSPDTFGTTVNTLTSVPA